MKMKTIILTVTMFLTAVFTADVKSSITPAMPPSCPLCKCGYQMNKCELESCLTSGVKEPECCQIMCQGKNKK